MKYEKGTFTTVPNRDILRGLDPQTQTLFMWICSYANDRGECYPSIDVLAKDCGMSRDTVIRRIDKLCELKLLIREHRSVENIKASNMYQIQIVGSSTEQLRSSREQLGWSLTATTRSSREQHKLKPYITKTNELNPPTPQGGEVEYSESFLKFWESYPKRIGKGAAYQAWEKARRPKLEIILSSIEKQKNSRQWNKDDGQFIPNPATWINQRRWEDETDTEAPTLIINR